MANSTALQLPPPYRGQNDRVPLFSLQNPFCERMENFKNTQGLLKLRQGNKAYALQTGAGLNSLALASYGTTRMLMTTGDPTIGSRLRWYSVTAGVLVAEHSLATTGETQVHSLYFRDYLYYFGDVALNAITGTGPQYYNGTVWGTTAYTWPASFNPIGGCVHKNRAYFIQQSAAAYGYSNIDAISGAVTKVDLGSIVSTKASLYIIRSISSTEATSQQNLAAFLFSNGDVLVYSGSYPDSSNWGLAARFKISAPIFYNSFADAKGDSFIFTTSEILSLRNLFISGYEKERTEGIGATIKNRWTQIYRSLVAQGVTDTFDYLRYIKGVYDENNDRLIISIPMWVNPTTGAADGTKPFQLIYDFTLGAWYEYVQAGSSQDYVPAITYFNGTIYFLTHKSTLTQIVQLEGKTNYLDDAIATTGTIGIDYKVRSAPSPISRFGIVQVGGMEAIMKSDIYPSVRFKFIANLGQQETEVQTITDSLGTTIQKPLFNVGSNANVVQYELYGTSTTSTIGLEIYATNLWITDAVGVAR